MKELSIEEKAKVKAYDEALIVAKQWYNDSNTTKKEKYLLKGMFSELVESEDERIKKALIDFFNMGAENGEQTNGVCDKDILTWLKKQGNLMKALQFANKTIGEITDENYHLREKLNEQKPYGQRKECVDCQCNYAGECKGYCGMKQSEQKDILEDAILDSNEDGLIAETIRCKNEKKPADKIEPKFKNEQWIVWQDKCYKVNYNGCGYELVDQNGLSTSLEYGTVDKNAHLWDITKDAKDGDVLCTYECCEPKIVFILKGTPKKHYALSYHCYYNIMYPHFASDSEKGCLAPNNEDVKPATKEQREQLKKAMTDAGYIFDFEKRELKKIELNHAWSEEDEASYQRLEQIVCKVDIEAFQGDRDLHSWLKSLRPQSQWKPSAFHLECIEDAIAIYEERGINAIGLKEILEELKKLREK